MRRIRRIALLVGAALLAGLLGGCTPQPWNNTLVSVNAAGTNSGNGKSGGYSVSADGTKIAFTSDANNLGPTDSQRPLDPVPGLFEEQRDVYLSDLTTGVTTLVSVNAAGTDSANNRSFGPVISPDGTKIAFSSWASDLGPTDPGGLFDSDIYVRDLTTGVTELVTVNAAGNDGIGGSAPVFSPDSTKLLFSGGTGYGPVDTNGAADIYLRDLTTDTTTLVSTNAAGTDSANGLSWFPELSPDGSKITFSSDGSNFGPADNNDFSDIYLRDLASGVTTLVSVNAAGTDGANAPSHLPQYSPDGNKIAFASDATDLGAVDSNENGDLYVRDLATGVTTLVSVNGSGTDSGNAYSYEPVFSPDSTKIAFISDATNFGPTDGNREDPDLSTIVNADVYLRDLVAGSTTLVSSNAAGTDSGNGHSTLPFFSPDGSKIAFTSSANDLGPKDTDRSDDTNQDTDVYVRDLVNGVTTLVSVNGSRTDSSNGASSAGGNDSFNPHGFTPQGHLVFLSLGSNLGAVDSNRLSDIYVGTYEAADVSVSLRATPEPVSSGGELTYELRAANSGPDTAVDAKASLLLPEATTFVGVSSTSGSCSAPTPSQPRLVLCELGDLAEGDDATVTVQATVTAPSGSTLSALGGVGSATVDILTADNLATATSTVSP